MSYLIRRPGDGPALAIVPTDVLATASSRGSGSTYAGAGPLAEGAKKASRCYLPTTARGC